MHIAYRPACVLSILLKLLFALVVFSDTAFSAEEDPPVGEKSAASDLNVSLEIEIRVGNYTIGISWKENRLQGMGMDKPDRTLKSASDIPITFSIKDNVRHRATDRLDATKISWEGEQANDLRSVIFIAPILDDAETAAESVECIVKTVCNTPLNKVKEWVERESHRDQNAKENIRTYFWIRTLDEFPDGSLKLMGAVKQKKAEGNHADGYVLRLWLTRVPDSSRLSRVEHYEQIVETQMNPREEDESEDEAGEAAAGKVSE